MIAWGAPCEKCQKSPRLRIATDGMGHEVETFVDGCEHVRKKWGICRHCLTPVCGVPGRSWFCEKHKKENEARVRRDWKARHPDLVREIHRESKRKWREENPGLEAQMKRDQYDKDRDRILLQRKARRKWNDPTWTRQKKRQRERYWQNPEEERARQRAYRQKRKADRQLQETA